MVTIQRGLNGKREMVVEHQNLASTQENNVKERSLSAISSLGKSMRPVLSQRTSLTWWYTTRQKIAEGEHERIIVPRKKFLDKVRKNQVK